MNQCCSDRSFPIRFASSTSHNRFATFQTRIALIRLTIKFFSFSHYFGTSRNQKLKGWDFLLYRASPQVGVDLLLNIFVFSKRRSAV